MEMLKKLFAITKNIDTTIKANLGMGAVYTVLAALIGLLNQLQLFLDIPSPLDYGHLRPIYTTLLIYGALLSFFSGVALYLIKNRVAEFKMATIAFVGMKLHHLAVILGLITIALGYNKGREYGEFTWIADDLMLLGLIHYLASILVVLKSNAKNDMISTYIVCTYSGGIVIYLLGNFGLPYSPLHSVSLFTGMQDQLAQEIYRLGVYNFFITMPAITLLLAVISEYYGVEIHSEATARFHILASSLILPLAGAGLLVHTAAPALLQTIGVFASFAFFIAVLAGAVHVHACIAQSGKKIQSDGLGLMLRWGGGLLASMAILRAATTGRTMQSILGYTYMNTRDLALDAQVYGILIALAAVLYIAQKIHQRNLGQAMLKSIMLLIVLGSVLMLIANLSHGFLQAYVATATDDAGALVNLDWINILTAGSLYSAPDAAALKAGAKASFLMQYLMSLRGIFVLGLVLNILGVLLASLQFLILSIRPIGTAYTKPELTVAEETSTQPAAGAAH